ncbi:hypothetical protein I6F25_001351 [Enterococcus faecalis]|nr:hypothetical protein [Enterococcus faecalis]EHU5030935.1 hypothetical protein [Enterococcus faecalis]
MKKSYKYVLIIIGSLLSFFIFICIAAFFFGVDETPNESEKEKQTDSFEEKVLQKNKNAKIDYIDDNIVITLPDEELSDAKVFINIKYPQLAAELLQLSTTENYNLLIIKTTATFLDDKGNEHEEILESSMFEKKLISEINFDNWIKLVTADSKVFYDLSSAYYIRPSVFIKTKGLIPNVAMKPIANNFWNNHGH